MYLCWWKGTVLFGLAHRQASAGKKAISTPTEFPFGDPDHSLRDRDHTDASLL
jgi:hypothetical protein